MNLTHAITHPCGAATACGNATNDRVFHDPPPNPDGESLYSNVCVAGNNRTDMAALPNAVHWFRPAGFAGSDTSDASSGSGPTEGAEPVSRIAVSPYASVR